MTWPSFLRFYTPELKHHCEPALKITSSRHIIQFTVEVMDVENNDIYTVIIGLGIFTELVLTQC